MVKFEFDNVTGRYIPAQFPGKKGTEGWDLPEDIKSDLQRLNNMIETKYTREYLKVCAFYNKMFPSLKSASWTLCSYNVIPFTSQDQESDDVGTGNNTNYLKQFIDLVTARIGSTSFEPALLADVPTLAYIIYKDEVERMLRRMVRSDDTNRMSLEAFHDAAILGYSHVLIDPWTHKWRKINDWELAVFETQMNHNDIKQCLYRDYAFPVASLKPYLKGLSAKDKEEIDETIGDKINVDFKMYIDCIKHEAYVIINQRTLKSIKYPFDNIRMVTFQWDVGFSKVTTSSLFDGLYPSQRIINKLIAKDTQLVANYKGPIPVFQGDCELAFKSIGNGAGDALYVKGPRPVTEIATTINPMPLDSTLDGKITSYKTIMAELCGIQQVSMDMENFRSAAAVVALDQANDHVFQAQVTMLANFIKNMFSVWVDYNATVGVEEVDALTEVDWTDVRTMINEAFIELKPVKSFDPLGNKGTGQGATPPDFMQIHSSRFVLEVLKGHKTFDDVDFTVDYDTVKPLAAALIIKLDTLSIDTAPLIEFLVQCFVQDIQDGVTQI
jgi:hypothetical protein